MMTYVDKHAGISKDQTRKTLMRTDSLVSMLSREELRSLIIVEMKPSVESVRREEYKGMYRNLFMLTITDVFTTGSSAATKSITNFPFLWWRM